MIKGSTPFTRIKHLQQGAVAKVRARIAKCDTKMGKGGAYLNGTLMDSDGEISFKIWSGREDVFIHYAAGKVIECLMKVSTYNNELQCVIESEQFLSETQAEEYSEDLVPTSPLALPYLIEEFRKLINKAHDIDENWPDADSVIEALTKAKLWTQYVRVPAAVHIHQAYVHGLLEHSVLVARYALATAEVTPNANIPLVIFGALFHDIGKCASFQIDPTGLASSVSEAGALLGHLVIGATYISSVFKKLLNPSNRMLLAHICISHHGRYEWGAAVLPAFKEAHIVHEADYLDSKMGEFKKSESKGLEGSISEKSWGLDRYLLTTGANLPPIIEEDEPEEE